ncbi:hypothetical protein [Micromonospora sp. RV43]|uniref:hypothetical protein n=1 Tax=Micromonospora sp. RV43 TaxID=1661387 RepID=UPI00064BA0BD|nr:hypothetical protein [Micromonospora sp. RV43]
MPNLNALDLEDLAVVPWTGHPARRRCVGCRQDQHTPFAVVVQVAGEIVCPQCVRNVWGQAAHDLVQELSRSYLSARRREVLDALSAAGERLIAQHAGEGIDQRRRQAGADEW